MVICLNYGHFEKKWGQWSYLKITISTKYLMSIPFDKFADCGWDGAEGGERVFTGVGRGATAEWHRPGDWVSFWWQGGGRKKWRRREENHEGEHIDELAKEDVDMDSTHEHPVLCCPRTGPQKDPDEADKKNIGPMQEEKRFSCTVSTQSFTGRYQFKTHRARHSEETDFMCDDCGKQCNREDKLGEHGKRMHNVLSKEERPKEGGEKHKAPDEKRRPVKTINDMESVARDKEGEVFGPETAEESRNLSRQWRGVTRETQHMLRQTQPKHQRNCLKLMYMI